MSWEDIDFDLIVPGMITRGPALESFGDYLNTFSQAYDERAYLVNKSLLNLTFQEGEITRSATEFSDKLNDLLQGYGSLITYETWYKPEVLDDILNANSYKYTMQDFIDELTQEVIDVLTNPNSFAFKDKWKADIFLALRKIYEMTYLFAEYPIWRVNKPEVTSNNRIYGHRDNSELGIGDDIYQSDLTFDLCPPEGPQYTSTNNAAYANFVDSWAKGTNSQLGIAANERRFVYNYFLGRGSGGTQSHGSRSVFEYYTLYRGINKYTLLTTFKKLSTDTYIDLQFHPILEVNLNYRREYWQSTTAEFNWYGPQGTWTNYGSYDNVIPAAGGLVEADIYEVSNTLESGGYSHIYQYENAPPNQDQVREERDVCIDLLPTPSNRLGLKVYQDEHVLDVGFVNNGFMVNLNNPNLDFYIDPEQS